MTKALKKRVYKTARLVARGDGFGVALDGKPVETPRGRALVLPTRALADAVAAEWAAQGETIDPLAMPLTRLAGSAIDLVMPHRKEVVARTAAYAATDLLCYRAEEPPGLVERQNAGWQPVVEWAAERYGAPLRVTAGVVAVEQPSETLARLAQAVGSYDDMALAALAAAAAAGSLLLALALAEGRLDAETAFALSQLDERYQSERWGEDPEALLRRAALRAEIAGAARFLALLAA